MPCTILRSALLIALTALQTVPAVSADRVAGVASVIDGDTIEIHGERIRLFGIDAAESGQSCTRQGVRYRCGQVAAFALSDKIGRRVVRCERQDTDRYGRMVATCRLARTDLGAWMVRQGQAIAFRKYSRRYVPEENKARSEKRGLWSGEFWRPSRFRRGGRIAKSRSSRSCTCPNDKDSAGRRCGKRSAYSRSGGRNPDCKP